MSVPRYISRSFPRSIVVVFAIICSISLVLVWSGSGLSSNNHKMSLVHIVMFEFKPDAAPQEVDAVSLLSGRQTME